MNQVKSSLKTPINKRLDPELKLRYNIGQAKWEIYSYWKGNYDWIVISLEQAVFYRDMGVPNVTKEGISIPDSHNIFL